EVRSDEEVDAIAAELVDRYGPMPEPVLALLGVARFRLLCRRAGVHEVVPSGRNIRFSPVHLPESRVMRLKRLYPGSVVKQAAGIVMVPKPTTARIGGQSLTGQELLNWAGELVRGVLEVQEAPTQGAKS
ncbi:MAG: TRCF domain-containing protein, partial [Cutibacterium avidum]|nr:TRCF domain-containing protein [Cutibacterium avidum]